MMLTNKRIQADKMNTDRKEHGYMRVKEDLLVTKEKEKVRR